MTTKKSKRLFGVVPGVKALITAASFAATLIGWAWMTRQDATVTQAANPPDQPVQAVRTPDPSAVPNTVTRPNRTSDSFSFQQNQGDVFAPFTLRGLTRSSR